MIKLTRNFILICLCLLETVYSYKMTDFIGVNDLCLRPVNWNSDSFFLVIDNAYKEISFSQLNFKGLGQAVSAKYFLSGLDNQLLVVEVEDSVVLLNLKTGERNQFPKDHDDIFLPQFESLDLWKFQSKKVAGQKLLTLSSVSITGQLNSEQVEFSLRNETNWKLQLMFFWSGRVFAQFQVDKDYDLLLELSSYQPNTNPIDSVVAFAIYNDSVTSSFLPASKKFVTLVKTEKDFQLKVYKIDQLHEELKKSLEKCRSIKEYDSSQTPSTINSLSHFLKSGSNEPCFNETPVLFNTSYERIKVDKKYTRILGIDLGHDINLTIYLTLKDGRINRCGLDTNGFEYCHNYAFPINVDDSMFSLMGIDSKTGQFVLPFDSENRTHDYRFFLFECDNFTRCETCEMIGGYRRCSWNQHERNCRENIGLSTPIPNTCHSIKSFEIQGIFYFKTLAIITTYNFQPYFGDKVYVDLDGNRETQVTPNNNVFRVRLPNEMPRNITLYIERSTGIPMLLRSYNTLENGSSTVFDIVLFLVFLFIVISIVFLVARYYFKKTLFIDTESQTIFPLTKSAEKRQLGNTRKSLVSFKDTSSTSSFGESLFVRAQAPGVSNLIQKVKSISESEHPSILSIEKVKNKSLLKIKESKSGISSKDILTNSKGGKSSEEELPKDSKKSSIDVIKLGSKPDKGPSSDISARLASNLSSSNPQSDEDE